MNNHRGLQPFIYAPESLMNPPNIEFCASRGRPVMLTWGVAILENLRAFRKDESGASLVIVGLTFPVFIGAMGLAAEVSYWQFYHRAMQNAADAAVIAAATNNKASYIDEAKGGGCEVWVSGW